MGERLSVVGIMLQRTRISQKESALMRVSCRWLVVLLFAVVVTDPRLTHAQTPETSQSALTIDAVTSSEPQHDGVQIHSGSATLRITALRDDIVRVRIAPGAELPEDASWAVLSEPR